MNFDLSGKLPGKTQYSGRRRTATRRSGFKSHPDSTGGEFKVSQERTIHLEAGDSIVVSFFVPHHRVGDIVAYGGWYFAPSSVKVSREDAMIGSCFTRHTLVPPSAPNWSKFGSMAISETGEPSEVRFVFLANEKADVAFFELGCGVVSHKHLDGARTKLLGNMYQFSPEAHFFSVDGDVVIDSPDAEGMAVPLYLKSCNRCARFLPVNFDNELIHLSFSNHCKAEHRRPCSHAGFGKLTNVDTKERAQLEYGYQLECRFCKKFEVNAAHNPQRTAAQMKEDGARRRALELLLTELSGESPQLRYRHKTGGRELADDIWDKFGRRCFNCDQPLDVQNKMHLDHTRPLALLWPLDGTATCLCGSCNSEKRDRSPATFYTKSGQLEALSNITGIPLIDLKKPTPNLEAIQLLQSKLDWFFEEFCQRPDLTKERDGKVAVELLVKAIQKTLNKSPGGAPFDLVSEYEKRRRK
ncbi:hypothetical protein [Vogesella indigofera]|uniref:hypothetical protein n=1 Tax=Vogesella indigofera TaxID=45465 RepID=UPI00234E7C44|nr:hypothetical protein [Vogesella indigofera]MDC7707263.1 hypothetical protein [Vogesella indigofera]